MALVCIARGGGSGLVGSGSRGLRRQCLCSSTSPHQPHRQRNRQRQQHRGVTALIMGAPGSGKGTISKKIINNFPSFVHLSTGDLLREAVREETALGVLAKRFMDQGELVPDDVVVDVLAQALQKVPKGKHTLLDGFPRTLPQGNALDKRLKLDFALEINVPRETIIDRLSDRWLCESNGRIYAYTYNPPKERGKDDETGEPLVRRPDDDPAVVERRLIEYEEITSPLLEHYKSKGLLTSFTGTKSDVIYVDVRKWLEEKLSLSGRGKF